MKCVAFYFQQTKLETKTGISFVLYPYIASKRLCNENKKKE